MIYGIESATVVLRRNFPFTMQSPAQNKLHPENEVVGSERAFSRSEREVKLEAQTPLGNDAAASEEAVSAAYVPPVKVERKFLVAEVPKVLGLRDGVRVSQGYLAVEKDGSEVRIRKTDQGASLFVKNAAGKAQVEVEVPLTRDQINALWPLTEGRRMSKVTYQLDVADTPVTLDMYEGQLSWLHIAEAEFQGRAVAEAFTPPPWFKREVSDLPAYKHSNLARE
jgi:CYTH domain-containing protein